MQFWGFQRHARSLKIVLKIVPKKISLSPPQGYSGNSTTSYQIKTSSREAPRSAGGFNKVLMCHSVPSHCFCLSNNIYKFNFINCLLIRRKILLFTKKWYCSLLVTLFAWSFHRWQELSRRRSISRLWNSLAVRTIIPWRKFLVV